MHLARHEATALVVAALAAVKVATEVRFDEDAVTGVVAATRPALFPEVDFIFDNSW